MENGKNIDSSLKPVIPPANINSTPSIQKGWVCPLCNKVWAPNIVGCFNCNKDKGQYSYGTDFYGTAKIIK